MRSLFAKIVGWFVLTVVIALTATILISALSYNPYSSSRLTPLSMLLSVEMSEACHAWETGGAPALSAELDRFKRATHVSEAILTDGQGTMQGHMFRIGHLGYFDFLDLLAVLGGLEITLLKVGHKVELGSGVRAAQNVFLRQST